MSDPVRHALNVLGPRVSRNRWVYKHIEGWTGLGVLVAPDGTPCVATFIPIRPPQHPKAPEA